jgi:hypothetical protein
LADVKHAGVGALEELDGLIRQLRELGWLREPTPGHFYWKSRAIVHFHEDPTGLYADVKLDPQGRFIRTRVSTRAEQDKLVRDIRRAGVDLLGA